MQSLWDRVPSLDQSKNTPQWPGQLLRLNTMQVYIQAKKFLGCVICCQRSGCHPCVQFLCVVSISRSLSCLSLWSPLSFSSFFGIRVFFYYRHWEGEGKDWQNEWNSSYIRLCTMVVSAKGLLLLATVVQ